MQVGAAIPNLDDGNQYMNDLLVHDIIARPVLKKGPDGSVALPDLPGLGFELDVAAVTRAEQAYVQHFGGPAERA